VSKPVTRRWWFAGRNASDRPAEDDPADHGTAFGLDLSLLQPLDEPADTSLPPATDAESNWVTRLLARRKPAT
jgi:hypothetical protein